MRRLAAIFFLLIAGMASADDVSFQRDVWPLFKRHCVGCHSEQKTKGRLRLDDVAALTKGGKTGPLFAAGKPDDSLLITQVSGDKPEMPENEAPLSAAKVKLLRDWVAQGAKIDGAPKSEVPPVVIPGAYTSPPAISSVTISPDGRLVAAACRSEVVLFNVDDNTAPRRLPTDFDLINHVEFSPDGKRLAAAGGSPQQFGGVIFFDPADGKQQGVRRIGADTFFKGNFAPDGQAIALGGANGAIHIIPVDAKAQPATIELHSDWVTAVAYTTDGKQLVSGSRDKTTKLSSVEGHTLLRSVDESPDVINAVAADPLTAISGGNARTLTGYDFKLALSGAEVTGSGNGARPINKRDQYVRAFEAQADAVLALATSGDRKLLAVATRGAEVRIYETEKRTRKTTIPKVPSPVLAIALNRDGTRVALGSKTGEVQIWDTASGRLIKSLIPVPVQPAVIVGK
jgi:WD40 repeat protein